ncbi:MAG: aminotransferase class III-fold pyridoxal phosphate-dependent enzyme [Nitrosomonadales bacterium]|nr:MAG: aminotransferase class III-fold pyridoxal phosphate-dependent enzyme [Nitrosomonadales bacterium]
MNETLGLYALGGGALLYGMARLKSRLELSLAKHRSLAGHPRMARRIAALVPYYSHDEREAFSLDGAPEAVVSARRAAFAALAEQYRTRFSNSRQLTAEVEGSISDLQFISAYRVPFQFRQLVSTSLKTGSFVQATSGVTVTDLDGNCFYDLTGSYGVNLFGYDFYKDCIAQGSALVSDLGPVLGVYHPVVADNVHRLQKVSGLDEVSFHMSGTEAVMQAVRLARYHSKRSHLVRFCGSYHGWWGDVQPGIGNPVRARDTYTLKEMDEATLHVLRSRRDIACVLVNPLQALHPNASAPGDSSLLDSSRQAGFSRAAYTSWLQELRKICDDKKIALIFDEVFVGFRLAPGGAQEYFGVRADMVTYGKTLGGGLPVGVLCGNRAWMKRFRDEAPADICFARGTFNAHPYVMGAMNVFLKSLESPAIQAFYQHLDETWNRRAEALNQQLRDADLPIQVANLSSIWTVLYTQPACYNWLFQYYLRLEGLALSWVGTGRLIFSLNYTEQDFDEVAGRFMRAARAMQRDGWWWSNPALTNKAIKRRVLREMLAHRP